MPYIPKGHRTFVDDLLIEMMGSIEAEGDLNYVITSLLHRWLKHKGVCYANLNAAIGVLECAKQELYRKIAAPYEDVKEGENGRIGILD